MKPKELIKSDKHRKAGIYILLLAGVFLLLFGSVPKKQTSQKSSDEETSPRVVAWDYIDGLESRLEETLSIIDGAGRVKVMLVAENEGSIDVGKDIDGESSKTVVLNRQSGGEALVIAQNAPTVAGAVIVSEGAGNDRVKEELAEAAATALGIGAHRVRVCKMAQSNKGD